jgi:hypothetical protein
MQPINVEKVKELFWSKVNIDPDGCWGWSGAKSPRGYGVMTINNKKKIATHVSWWLETGDWPTAWMLHKCDNPPCIRPDHLFVGNQTDNMRDAHSKGRTKNTFVEKEFCKHGHPMSGDNVGLINSKARGKILRYCKECSKLMNQKWSGYKQKWYIDHRVLKNNGKGRSASI